ncbi:MAG: nucleotidyl transferase AbiEii/AbiGii toxin family protein [Anaerolineales bacterium]|nr:nucleotidyl transferase AbiEii/AbiGii toxin family protein [Anaerolineales bacterium]
MIGQDSLVQAARSQQTTELNVAREYCQHLFLSSFYRQAGSERILFKGGTALRIVFGSPRFSEDLDFSGFGATVSEIETWVLETVSEIEQHGIGLELAESKTTSGGYLATMDCRVHDYSVRILIEISLRSQARRKSRATQVQGQGMLITPDFLPAYTLMLLPEAVLVDEKLNALLTRGKPRDYYDAYFLLRKGMVTVDQRLRLAEVKQKLLRSKLNLQRELALFLPRSHHAVLRDFNRVLEAELTRHGA